MDDDRENCTSNAVAATVNQRTSTRRHLNQILRPLNHLGENHLILNSSLTCTSTPTKNIQNHRPRFYLSLNFLDQHHDDLLHWLESSLSLINSFDAHRSSWPQIFLTYLIEDPSMMKFDFRLCHDCSMNSTHHCISEDELHQLQMIIRKRKRFSSLNSLLIDHLRQIILFKSLEQNQNEYLTKELRNVKQTLIEQYPTWPRSRICSLHSKFLLFLSSLYSMKIDTMRMFFVQHPSYYSLL